MGSFWDKMKGLLNSDSDKLASKVMPSEKNGGIVKINCAKNGKYLIHPAATISGFQIIFDTAKKSGSILSNRLKEDWTQFGPEAFYLEVMKVVPRPEGMIDEDYDDLLSAAQYEVSQGEDPALSY
ncbi:MAG: hypothetical protein JW817_06905 [Clostridiales bacterium]|nr:hypothetical protein [Clostridiales bacterium]